MPPAIQLAINDKWAAKECRLRDRFPTRSGNTAIVDTVIWAVIRQEGGGGGGRKEKNAARPVAGAAVSRSAEAAGGAQVQRLRSIPAGAATADLLELAGPADPIMGGPKHLDCGGTPDQCPHHRRACLLLSHRHRGGESRRSRPKFGPRSD